MSIDILRLNGYLSRLNGAQQYNNYGLDSKGTNAKDVADSPDIIKSQGWLNFKLQTLSSTNDKKDNKIYVLFLKLIEPKNFMVYKYCLYL